MSKNVSMNLPNAERIGRSVTKLVDNLSEKARFTKEMVKWLTMLGLLVKGGAHPGLIYACAQSTTKIAKAASYRSVPTKREVGDTKCRGNPI